MHDIHYRDNGNGKVEIRYADKESSKRNEINLNGGVTSRDLTCTIVSDYDRQRARERSQKLKEEGTTVRERLAKTRKHMTSTKLTIDGRHYHIDKYVYKHVLNRRNVDDEKKVAIRKKEGFEYAKLCYKADKALNRNPFDNVKEWRSISDIKAYLGPLKIKDKDPAWSSNRPQFEILFMQWTDRRRNQLVMEEDVMNKFSEWVREDETKNKKQDKGKSI